MKRLSSTSLSSRSWAMSARFHSMRIRPLKVSIVLMLTLSCTTLSAAHLPSQIDAPWPDTVTKRCPKTKIPLECFRKGEIRRAMHKISPQIQACHRKIDQSQLVTLRMQTRGGRPTCVEYSPRRSAHGQCVAQAVARHFQMQDSPADEQCDIHRYPFRFEP